MSDIIDNLWVEKMINESRGLILDLDDIDIKSPEDLFKYKNEITTTSTKLYDMITFLEKNSQWLLVQFEDMTHYLKNELRPLKQILDGNADITLFPLVKNQILDSLKKYQNPNLNIHWKTKLSWIENYLKEKKRYLKLHLDIDFEKSQDRFYLWVSSWVLVSILNELFANYKKYWNNWKLRIMLDKKKFLIILNNQKKDSNWNYSSKQWLGIIKKYLKEVSGSLSYDYGWEDCVTKIVIPLFSGE